MQFRRTALVAALSVVALTAAACGDDAEDSAAEPTVAEAPEFEAGTTMAELAEAGTITIGTKFDQPGFGLENLEGEVEGFDVEVAKIIAGALGIAPEDITFEQTPLRGPRGGPRGRRGRHGRRHLHDQRRPQGADHLRRPVLHRPASRSWSRRTTTTSPARSRSRTTRTPRSAPSPAPPRPRRSRSTWPAPTSWCLFDEYSQCADSLSNGQVAAVTTDNVILLGFVSESDGDFKLVGEQFTEEPYGIGIAKGDVAFCEFINETLQENEDAYIEAWESTAGEIEGTQTPELPEPDACA